jgi:hypothetical protein
MFALPAPVCAPPGLSFAGTGSAMKKSHRRPIGKVVQARTAAGRQPAQGTSRRTVGVLLLALGGFLLAWYLVFPEEFHFAVGVVRGWFHSPAKAPAVVEEAAVNKTPPPGPAPEGMVWIPGGKFWMGTEESPDAMPVHLVELPGYWMDRTEVTNAQFAKFVKATGYVTVAERRPDPKEFTLLRPEILGFARKYSPELLAGQPTGFPLLVGAVAPVEAFPAATPWGVVASLYPIVEPVSQVFEVAPDILFKEDR